MQDKTIKTALHHYIEIDDGFYTIYEDYEVDQHTIDLVKQLQPQAYVVTPSRYTCSDCVRNVSAMTRIAESLPGWEWDIFSSEGPENKSLMQSLNIERIPTFIVYDRKDGNELGRIVENPVHGSLEQDLLHIVQGAASK